MPQTLLEFFVLEASDYLDQLDLALKAPSPDADRLRRIARALRGAARMADQEAIATAAGALQSVAQALLSGARAWDAEVAGALVHAVDEFRIVVRGLSSGAPAEELDARARAVAERLGVPETTAARQRAQDDQDFWRFLAGELNGVIDELAKAIGVLEGDPRDRESLKWLLRKIRPLRGMQAVSELPTVGVALAALEDVILQIAEQRGPVGPGHLALFRRAREALEEATRTIAAGRRPAATGVERAELEGLRAEVLGAERAEPSVSSITEFFYDGEGPHVVSASLEERGVGSLDELFRLEATGCLDVADRLWADVEKAASDAGRRVLVERLAQAYADLGDRAVAFGRPRLGAAARRIEARLRRRAPSARAAVEPLGDAVRGLHPGLRRVIAASDEPTAQAELDGIERGLDAALEEEVVVPIESLLYSPQDALVRAIEIAREVRSRFEAGAPLDDAARERIAELHDLLLISAGQAARA